MTVNALLAYLGAALAFLGAAFTMLALRRPRERRPDSGRVGIDVSHHHAAVTADRRSNAYCAAMLLSVAATAELVSLVRGGPATGEPSGNAPGGFLAISLMALFCLIGCLIARHFIWTHLYRRALARTGCRSE